jgi:hypothetical protein
MGINDLQLSPELIAALYPETLVTERNPMPVSSPARPGETRPVKTTIYSFLGMNLRSICVLVSYPNDEFIPGDQLVFLQKILEACKCSMDDIALINTHRQPLDMEKLKNQFSPQVIFLWGSLRDIPGLQNPLPDMAVTLWENIIVLPVAQADLMSRNGPEGQELKRILWTSLKKIFNL